MCGVIGVVCAISIITREINVRIVDEMGFGNKDNVNYFFLKDKEEFVLVIF